MYPALFNKSNRNNDVLVDSEGYEYVAKNKPTGADSVVYWNCRRRNVKCPARAKTQVVNGVIMIAAVNGMHCHGL